MKRSLTSFLASGLLVAVATTGSACVDGEGAELDSFSVRDGSSVTRTLAEEHLAEDLEALLPGTWGLVENEIDAQDLGITFLGHDAITGDVAVLIETGLSRRVHPARVVLAESGSVLRFLEEERVFLIEQIDVDRLVLLDAESNTRLVYTRTR